MTVVKKQVKYLVSLQSLKPKTTLWEPKTNLGHWDELIDDFHLKFLDVGARHGMKTRKQFKGIASSYVVFNATCEKNVELTRGSLTVK